jgi:hypothetical protein
MFALVEYRASSTLAGDDMDGEQNLCTFRGDFGSCNRPIEADGLCVMHSPKVPSRDLDRLGPEERASAEDRTRKFFEELEILAEHAPDLSTWDGIRFPAIEPHFESAFQTILEFGAGRRIFQNCVFEDDVDLCLVNFANVVFYGATFKGKTFFNSSKFTHRVEFFNVHFCQEVQFANVQFLKGGRFFLSSFDGPLSFAGATIAADLDFISTQEAPGFHAAADFWGLKFKNEATIKFDNVCLARTSFAHTDLTDFSFINVQWYSARPTRLINGQERWRSLIETTGN